MSDNDRPTDAGNPVPAPERASGSAAKPAFSPPKPYPRKGGASFHKPGCECLACRRRVGAKASGSRSPRSPVALTAEQAHLKAAQDDPEGGTPNQTPNKRGSGEVVLFADDEILRPLKASGNTIRDRVEQWIYYRATEPGITNAEIARRLGLAPPTLNRYLHRARSEGWLQIDNPMDRLEIEVLPKIVDNLNFHLDNKSERVTIEAAKGLLFPLWKEQHGIEENKVQVLGIKIEMPPGGVTARGIISGVPRKIGETRQEPEAVDATFTSNPDKT